MKYIEVKKKDKVCNICEKDGDNLSWDHVPPKGGIELTDMELRVYNSPNFNPNDKERDVIQNGLKFKTLCSKCNSVLGAKFDKCFNLFIRHLILSTISNIILPETIYIKTNPTRIIKALLGHLLASKTSYCNTKFDNAVKKYILDDNAILPKDIHVYYWYYPYKCTIISNDILQMNIVNGAEIFFSVLKFFPIAFAISHEYEFYNHPFHELTKYNNDNIEEEKELPFSRRQCLPYNFPEYPDSGRINLRPNTKDIFATNKNN